MRFSPRAWTLILAAYAYEVEAAPIMEDATFDILAASYAADPDSEIPGFGKETGSWVHALVPLIGEEVLRDATARCRQLGMGTSPWHCVPNHLIEDVDGHGPPTVLPNTRLGAVSLAPKKGEPNDH